MSNPESTPISLDRAESRICPECGLLMYRRSGRFGKFWGCSNFPDCKCTIGADGAVRINGVKIDDYDEDQESAFRDSYFGGDDGFRPY